MVSAGTERFGNRADAYTRGRPTYPAAIVAHLEQTGLLPRGATVVDLGVGTGLSSEPFLQCGYAVIGVEPNAAMRAAGDEHLRQYPNYRSVGGTAEATTLPNACADLVIAGQAFHWFDHERALPEIARVLRPGGTLALVWNLRDESVPWVRRLGKLIGSERPGDDPNKDAVEILERSGLFEGIETRTFRHWQEVGRDSLIGLVESRSYVAAMAERERAALLRQVGELYDEYGRGHDGMQLPYLTECYRAHVVSTFGTGGTHGGLDDGLLIDFS
jgi:SAM-dependent methyltransferase